MVDIDFMANEYDHGMPRALVEYKAWDSPTTSPNANTIGLRNLANGYHENGRVGIPMWQAQYWRDTWAVRVTPLNAKAVTLFGGRRDFSEREYVAKLYAVRGRGGCPAAIYLKLNAVQPPLLPARV
jgi:hypothetical protein